MVEDGKWFAPATAWQGFLLGYAKRCHLVSRQLLLGLPRHARITADLSAPTSAVLLLMFSLYLGLYHGLFGLLLALIAGGATDTACELWCSRHSPGSPLKWRGLTSPDSPGTCWAPRRSTTFRYRVSRL